MSRISAMYRRSDHRWASRQVGVIPNGCPDGFWSVSNCLYLQLVGMCRAPRCDRPVRPLEVRR